MAAKVRQYGSGSGRFFADLQVWGTPGECFEKLSLIREKTGCQGFIAIFDMADLPFEDAERSMKLFATEVAPRLKDAPQAALADANQRAAPGRHLA
jgi:hypothetical protein